jgi:hypothetical protein
MGIDHPLFRIDPLERLELAAQLRSFCVWILVFLGLGQDVTNAADVLDELLLLGPVGLERG